MKPIRLQMQAFGSYGKKADIDFTKPSQNLFLITGDTGSGKSTIFDALVFALFGETSSSANRKTGEEMQSQFASPGTEPYVKLTFSTLSGGSEQEYTVFREPRHSRPKKRGTGMISVSEKVTLEMPDGSIYPEKETNLKLLELVGLTKDQFMQTAMIAQGEFIRLLQAKSNEKKEIFRKLFRTGIYDDISAELKRRFNEKEAEIASLKMLCVNELSRVSLPDDFEEEQRLKDLLTGINTASDLSVVDIEEALELLKKLTAFLKEKAKEAQRSSRDAQKTSLKAHEELSVGEQLLKSYQAKEEAEATLEDCEKKESQVQSISQLITDLRKAYEIQSIFQRYQDQLQRVGFLIGSLQKEKDRLPDLKTDAENAKVKHEEASSLQKKETAAYSAVKERVNQTLSIFKKMKKAQKEIEEKQRSWEILKDTYAKVQDQERELGRLEERLIEQESHLLDSGSRLESWKNQMEKWDSLAADLKAITKLEEDLNLSQKNAAAAVDHYRELSAAFEEKNQEYLSCHRAFMDQQAGYLAQNELHPNEPCPVCGSLDHPHPAALSQDLQHLTRERIEELERETDSLRQKVEEASQEAGSKRQAADEKKSRLDESLKQFRSSLNLLIPDLPDQASTAQMEVLLKTGIRDHQAIGEKIRQDVDTYAKIRQSLEGMGQRKKTCRDVLERAEQQRAKAFSELEAAKSALQSLSGQAEFSNEAEALHTLKQAEETYQVANRAAEGTKTSADRAAASLQECKTRIAQYEKELPEAASASERLKTDYQKILDESQIEEERWKDLTERYRRQDPDRMQAEVDAFNRQKTQAESLLQSAVSAIAGREKPDLNLLKQHQVEADRKAEELNQVSRKYEDHLSRNREILTNLESRFQKRECLLDEFQRIKRLYQTLSGKQTGMRMDLETYVQRYYLEQILFAANLRFQEMSGGQFELRMYRLEHAGEGANHGLDLMVYSSVTGQERPVNTLSGGESFMAALSLALGMADQVTAGSAAVNLDMMFIDEGFGTLDDHARAQAVRVLKEMAGSSKMIGIISHVSELKQEIDDQLIVTKDDRGSHVRWQVS